MLSLTYMYFFRQYYNSKQSPSDSFRSMKLVHNKNNHWIFLDFFEPTIHFWCPFHIIPPAFKLSICHWSIKLNHSSFYFALKRCNCLKQSLGAKKEKRKTLNILVIVKYTFELKRDPFNGCFSIKRTLNLANPNIIFRTHWILIFYLKNDLNGVHRHDWYYGNFYNLKKKHV